MPLICVLCEEEIDEHHRTVAFDEVVFSDDEWEALDSGEIEEIDEVEPFSGQWKLAHYFCMFKKKG